MRKGLSQVSSEHTLNDRQSSLQELPRMTSSNIQTGNKVDKNIFYQFLNNASNTDLQSQKDNLHASQSELSNGAMNAIELVKDHHAAANGLNSYINNMNFSLNSKASEVTGGHKQSVFNRVNAGSNIGGRENAFSVSGQKVVHFKDAATTDQLSSDERKSNLNIFVRRIVT